MILSLRSVKTVPVCVFAADPRLIDLDNATEFGFRLNQSGADFVAHGMCGFVRAEAHDALDLQSADALFASQHHVDDAKPLAERLVRVLEDGPSDVGKAIASALDRLTLIALPFEGHGLDRKHLIIAAARAMDAIRPTAGYQIFAAGFLIDKPCLELADGHLVDGLRTLGHDGSPYRQEPQWQI